MFNVWEKRGYINIYLSYITILRETLKWKLSMLKNNLTLLLDWAYICVKFSCMKWYESDDLISKKQLDWQKGKNSKQFCKAEKPHRVQVL